MGNKLTTCKTCNQKISKGVKKCVHCGADQRPSRFKIMAVMAALLVVAIIAGALQSSPTSSDAPKYEIKNLSDMYISDSDFEQLYEKAKNASIAWIDELDETDYLEAEKCSLTVFEDKSAALVLRTTEKPGVIDNSVLVTFKYLPDEKNWKRIEILYNKQLYGD